MTYVINEPCIGVKDSSCVEVCPWTAFIRLTSGDQVPAEWTAYIEENAAYYRGEDS